MNETDLKQAEHNIRKLLDEMYGTSNLMTFDELAGKFSELLPLDFKVAFYIRAKARFGIEKESCGYLKFPYMSFVHVRGTWRKFDFSDNEDVDNCSAIFGEGSMDLYESEGFVIYYPRNPDLDYQRIRNLIKRLFISFYNNCGGYDHYKESVLARYIKEYYKNYDFRKIDDLLGFVNGELGLSVAIGQHQDRMLFLKDADYSALIESLKGDLDYIDKLFEYKKFVKDLTTSILKKNQTFDCSDEGIKYVIRTFSNEYFLDEESSKFYKSQQKNIAIYTSNNEMCLESVFYANGLIKNVLNTLEEYERENILHDLNDKCLLIEDQLSERPVSKVTDLFDQYNKIIDDIVKRVVNSTFADSVSIKYYSPIDNELIPLCYFSSRDDAVDVEITPVGEIMQKVSVSAFVLGEVLSLNHVEKINKEIRSLEASKNENISKYNRLKEDRLGTLDDFGSNTSSVVSIPIRVGSINWGVIQFSSIESASLASELSFFNKVARSFGDSIRRVNLANDRGWFTKLSFVHASRHRIEAILRDLKKQSHELADELEGIFDQHAAVHNSDYDSGSEGFMMMCFDNIKRVIEKNISKPVAEDVFSKLVDFNSAYNISPHCVIVIQEIFDALISNTQHSDIDEDGISISSVFVSDKKAYLKIDYLPDNSAFVSFEKSMQIGISPIDDVTTNTYHYGLFLLAAQVRMVGGLFSAKSRDTGADSSIFGLSFLLPMSKESL